MYPPPFGIDLTSEQAGELDDTFWASDPYEYFRGRIAGLLSWAENAPRKGFEQRLPDDLPGSSSLRAEFTRYLRRRVADTHFAGIDVDAQIAADALTVRHHAAEALVRLACARLAPDTTAVPCLWAAIANGAFAIGDVITLLSKSARKPNPKIISSDSSSRRESAIMLASAVPSLCVRTHPHLDRVRPSFRSES